MNNSTRISPILLILLCACSTVGKKDNSLVIHQVGENFENNPVKITYIGKYESHKGILKSKAKKLRKKQLLDSVENALKAVFNLGSAYLHPQGRFSEESILNKANSLYGTKDHYAAIINDKYLPEFTSNAIVKADNKFQFIPYRSEEDKFSCNQPRNHWCQKKPATLIYQVGDKYSGYNRSSLILGGLAASQEKIAIPSYKIHAKHQSFIPSIPLSEVYSKEKQFISTYSYLEISKTYQNILSDNFKNCERRRVNEYLDLEECLSRFTPPSVYVSRKHMKDNQLAEKLAVDEQLRFNYWGILWLLHTKVSVKRINENSFQITLITNTPKLYKSLTSASKFIE